MLARLLVPRSWDHSRPWGGRSPRHLVIPRDVHRSGVWHALGCQAIQIGAVLFPAVASGQQPTTIADPPSCQRCEIVVGPRRLSLVDTASTPLNGFVAAIRERVYLAAVRAGAPLAFDRSGRVLRSLGRTGSGPGEFRSSSAFIEGPGDSVAVYDGPNGRIDVFDRDLRFVRAFPLGQAVVQGGILWLPRGEPFVMSGVRRSPSEIGYTIHLYAGNGGHVRSIGESRVPFLPSSSGFQMFRLLQPLANDELVSVSVSVEGGYSIDIWDLASGRLRQQWLRKSKWFEVQPGPFPPRVLSARTDSTGVLWILIVLRSPDWEKGARVRVIGSGREVERTYEVVDPDLISDSMIEVVDLRTGQLLAQRRFDQLYAAQLANGLLAALSREHVGLDLFPVALKGR